MPCFSLAPAAVAADSTDLPEGGSHASLGQYPTPGWVAEALFERHFSDLSSTDCVFEPTCGPGAFLAVVPDHVAAFGCELDLLLAAEARRSTGRPVITGDVLAAKVPRQPTVIVGNPPFRLDFIDQLLRRAHALLPSGGRAGLVLPAYAFQTAARVAGYAESWSIAQEMIPRNIYEGLKLPLVFATFTKDGHRKLFGFALYREAAQVQRLGKAVRARLNSHLGPVWARAVESVLELLGGAADLSSIYAAMAKGEQRSTENPWWKAKVRQTLRRYSAFECVGPGRYALRERPAPEVSEVGQLVVI